MRRGDNFHPREVHDADQDMRSSIPALVELDMVFMLLVGIMSELRMSLISRTPMIRDEQLASDFNSPAAFTEVESFSIDYISSVTAFEIERWLCALDSTGI